MFAVSCVQHTVTRINTGQSKHLPISLFFVKTKHINSKSIYVTTEFHFSKNPRTIKYSQGERAFNQLVSKQVVNTKTTSIILHTGRDCTHIVYTVACLWLYGIYDISIFARKQGQNMYHMATNQSCPTDYNLLFWKYEFHQKEFETCFTIEFASFVLLSLILILYFEFMFLFDWCST